MRTESAGVSRRARRITNAATATLAAAAITVAGISILATQAANAGTVPVTALQSGGFEHGIRPWVGTGVSAAQISDAPDGSHVGRASNQNWKLYIDNWPGVGGIRAGATYTTWISVASATHGAYNAPAMLVIREHTPSGAFVASNFSWVRMRYAFQRLTISLTAHHTGDYIDIYVYDRYVHRGAVIFVDHAGMSMTSTNPTPPPTSPPPTSPPPTGDAPSTLGLLAYGSGQPTALGNTSGYKYVVVQENQFSHISEVKRMNPKTQVLAYMNTSTDSRTDCSSDSSDAHYPGASFGVNYCYATRYHPEWFLTDRSGNRLHFSDYSFAMQMDPGSASFADAWAAGVYAQAKRDGFDGIWIDDLNVEPGHGLDGRFAKYSDEQFGAATAAWTARVGDYLRSHGMSVIANVGMAPWIGYQLTDTIALGRHLTAVNREHYVRYGDICGPFGERFNNTASNGTPPLSSFLNETKLLQAQGTKITGVDYGYSSPTSDDTATMTYGRALFLLSWDGSEGSAYFYRKCGVNDTAAPQWTASVGLPAGPIETDGNGVMTRKFQHGIVILNPNRGGSAAKVSVPAGLHTMSGATEDGGVYVAPQTAAILSS